MGINPLIMSVPAPPLEPETLNWLEQLPAAAVWLDERGVIRWCNPSASAIIPNSDPLGRRLENWFQPVVRETRTHEAINASWWQGRAQKGLLGLAGKRWRWFQVALAPYHSGQLCILHDVTNEYNQALAYASSLEVLSSLLTQEDKLDKILLRILQTAVEVVPGADAGSLTLLENGQFKFVAQIGFDESLVEHALSYEDEQAWYGLGEDDWLVGKPRLLVAPHIQQRTQQRIAHEFEMFSQAGRLEDLKATVTVPIVLQGQVMGTLNLDSLTSTEAFPTESLAIAQTFALQAATVLYGLLSRRHLSEIALNDALTGLGNRHALEEAFTKIKAQAKRLDLPLTLIYWDMDGLKRINDQYGHAAGDQALKLLAKALRSAFRQEDLAFRIGGDEFVSLHLGLQPSEAPEVVRRVRGAIHVAVSAGAVDVAPSKELQTVLEQADAAMYADKRRPKELREP